MEPIYSIALTAAISGIVGSIVSAITVSIKGAGKKVVDTDEAMKAGMRALLWRELQTIHEQAMEQGGLTVTQRRHLESVYKPYHGLGGNGTGTRLYEDAMNQPVLD